MARARRTRVDPDLEALFDDEVLVEPLDVSELVPHELLFDPLDPEDAEQVSDVLSVEAALAEKNRQDYVPSPTFWQFMDSSSAFVRGVRGPIGSGKTVGCFQELWRIARWQRPQADGVRRSRFAVIRNTYPELISTSLATFRDWFGDVARVTLSAPIRALVKCRDVDTGDWIEAEFVFIALDKPNAIKKLKSLELTAAFLNEASELPYQVLDMAKGRVGRYPAKKDAPAIVGACVIMDTNSMDDDHWWYELAEEKCPPNHAFWTQPPALVRHHRADGSAFYLPHPKCENAEHQPKGYGYWLDLIQGSEPEFIDVFVLNQYGRITDDRPCYPSYFDRRHCARDYELQPLRGLPLSLGFDFGHRPACVIGQLTPAGQLRVYHEIVTPEEGWGTGLEQFLTERVLPFLAAAYPGAEWAYQVWGDPAGATGAEADAKINCYRTLAKHGLAGSPPTETNHIQPRLDAVRRFLGLMVQGEPGLLISRHCTTLRKGFRGHYVFERVQVRGLDKIYRDAPKKNHYSHVHDALQYLALGLLHGAQMHSPPRAKAREVVVESAAGWT